MTDGASAARAQPSRGPAQIPVRGLYETQFAVSELERSVAFYRDVVGLAPARLRALGVTPLSFFGA
jgi:hypothetical protein